MRKSPENPTKSQRLHCARRPPPLPPRPLLASYDNSSTSGSTWQADMAPCSFRQSNNLLNCLSSTSAASAPSSSGSRQGVALSARLLANSSRDDPSRRTVSSTPLLSTRCRAHVALCSPSPSLMALRSTEHTTERGSTAAAPGNVLRLPSAPLGDIFPRPTAVPAPFKPAIGSACIGCCGLLEAASSR